MTIQARLFLSVSLSIFALAAKADEATLAELSLEELTVTEITSASRKNQSMNGVAAAAFVISAEDIHRSGAQALPDVLRMVPGIQVAQIDNGRYAVTARSFNGRFANKLQILVDGRSVFHPLFGGVLWELDIVPLADIERIEVIRGPSAVTWGANAVNGLINIITRPARNRNDNTLAAAGGTHGTGNLYARIGRTLDDDSSWRLSAQARHAEPSRQAGRPDNSRDRLDTMLLDFRFDRALGNGSDLSLWANASRSESGDIWMAKPNFSPTGLSLSLMRPNQLFSSESLVGRYRWLTGSGVESTVQASLSKSSLAIDDFIDYSGTIYDLDYQGRYALDRHDLLWGLSQRTVSDYLSSNEPYLSFTNRSGLENSTGIFLHDEWTLVPDTFKLGFGSRLERSTGNSRQYALRATALWTPTSRDTLWLKLSRAPRFAPRSDRETSIIVGANVQRQGALDLPILSYFQSNRRPGPENIHGLEIGYRAQPKSNLSIDANLYRYHLNHLRSGSINGQFSCTPLLPGIPFDQQRCATFGAPAGSLVVFNLIDSNNEASGWNDGFELAVDWLALANWRLQLSYAWSDLRMARGPDPYVNITAEAAERGNPRHTLSLRSQWNIADNRQFDLWLRGASQFERMKLIDITPNPTGQPTYDRIPGYLTLDLRYAYRWRRNVEFALTGRNLLQRNRVESVSDSVPTAISRIPPTWMLSSHWSF